MTEAVVSLLPQRPPPPNRTTSPVGVSNPAPKQMSEREDSFRFVDSRAKSKQKPQLSPTTKQKSSNQPLRSSSASPDHGFTIIDSKHSPLLERHSPTKVSVPPPRPHPPTRQNTTSEGRESGEAINGRGVSRQVSQPLDSVEVCVDGDAREGGEPVPVPLVDHPPPPSTKVSQPPARPQQPPMRQQSVTVTSTSSQSDVSEGGDRHNSVGKQPVKDEQVTETKAEDKETEANQRARPGRPPPPRSKSVPRAKSLTEHKQKRMRERSPTIDVTTRIAHQEGKLPNTQKRTMRERSPTIDVTTRIAHQEGKLPNTQKRTMRERSPTIDVTTRIAHQEGKLPNTQKRTMRERSPTIDVTTRIAHQEDLQNRPAQPSTKPSLNHSVPQSPTHTTPPSTTPPPTTPTRLSPHVPIDSLVDLSEGVETSLANEGSQDENGAPKTSPVEPTPPRPSVRSPPPPPTRNLESTPTRHTTPQQPAVIPVPHENPLVYKNTSSPEETLSSTPADASNVTADTNSPTAASSPPVIPARPYMPPRPFPPRPNSGSKRAPAKPKRSNHPSKKVAKSHTAIDLSPRMSHGKPPRSHDMKSPHSSAPQSHDSAGGSKAIMASVEVSQVEPDTPEYPNTPTLSITNHDVVQFGFPSHPNNSISAAPPDYDSSLPATVDVTQSMPATLPPVEREISEEGATEGRDEVADLQPSKSSSRFRGKKMFSSMKKGIKSLRLPRKPIRADEVNSQRRKSEGNVGTSRSEDYPDPLPQGIIEPLVVKCVAYLNRDDVLVEQGLFRIPGDLAAIRKLRTSFLNGVDVDLGDVLDPHTVCGLLKLHFRELRVSMIPRGPPLAELIHNVKERNVDGVHQLLSKINVTHIATLRIVTEVLAKVVSHSDVNRMTAGTLATSCGPSIFPYLPPSNANQLLKFLVDHCQEIFET